MCRLSALEALIGHIYLIIRHSMGYKAGPSLAICEGMKNSKQTYRNIRQWMIGLILLATGVVSSAYAQQPGVMVNANAQDMTYEELIDLIEEKNFSRIEDLLKYLDETNNPLLSQYVVMLESQSAQEAEPENPRVLVFGQTAQMILTFNGHPKQKGYDRLETIRYLPKEHRFQLQEIIFQGDQEERKAYLEKKQKTASLDFIEKSELTAEDIKQMVHQGEPNRQFCLACHRQDPRPNWEPYNLWPGALFGFENRITFRDKEGKETLDWKRSKRFLDSFEYHPRYKHLSGLRQDKQGIKQAVSAGSDDFVQQGSRMLESLTSMLADMNAKRIAARLAAKPRFEDVKFALLGANANCDNFLDMVNASNLSVDPKQAKQMSEETKAIQLQVADELAQQTSEFVGYPIASSQFKGGLLYEAGHNVGEDPAPIGKFRYVAEALLGVDPYEFSGFSMSFFPKTYLFTMTDSFRQVMSFALEHHLTSQDREMVKVPVNAAHLGPVFHIENFDEFERKKIQGWKAYCQKLEQVAKDSYR